ncbi:hypothetical protein Taro_024899 [Colocasia esculenta]|uniref:Receptor-like serine/threonine-protein kinase n=1 Tax=Colocasia esculenta TaxID=4460 RepID=A0A843VCM4_COLES|nr:hypothetical protein [Colocasia esculenta]
MALRPVLLIALLLSCLVFPRAHVGEASDELSPDQSLSGNQRLVSKDGNFELGLFCPGKNSHKYYVGIWFGKIPKQTVVWVANREAPVADPSTSELRISENGDLVILSPSKAPAWTSNSSTRPSAMDSFVAQLLDNGNLVVRLRSDSSAVVWQSFDHPTDTWLPGGWLGLNRVTGEYQYLHSWRSTEDPAPGQFSYHLDEEGSSQFFLRWNGSVSYWTTGNWTGQFSKMPEVVSSTHFNFTYADVGGQRRGYTYSVQSSFVFTRATLNLVGRIVLLVWLQGAQEWQQVWAQPIKRCDAYSVCGAFSICNEQNSRLCECLQGFEPVNEEEWERGDWSSGCARRTHLNCGNSSLGGSGDGFLPVSSLQLPTSSQELKGKSIKECEIVCLEDCYCTAYACGSGCSVWNGELRNAQKVFDGDANSQKTLYVRLPTSELPTSASEHVTAANVAYKPVIIGIVLGGVFLTFAALGLLYRMRRQSYEKMRVAEGHLISFTYGNLLRATNNFSEILGQGGFGSVFRGTLPDSTAVAVKRLQGAAQGEKQFCTEVRTLGTVHHVNLVRLRGFCAQGTRKLLVYECMPNGSLNAHLFGSGRSKLSWNLRYQIMLGVAGGLAYLHEKCRESIIHCDIKPENILLDAAFQPKIADFGLTKLLGRDFSRVLTSMRGTIGYLAPEWLSGLPITSKADVYSYGMLVFEIISGRRNTDKRELSEGISFFPLWVASKLCEGEELLGLLDETLHGAADADQLTRACKVACWCIQESEDHRPSMNQVVQILEGVVEVGTPPVPRTLQHFIGEESDSISFSFVQRNHPR